MVIRHARFVPFSRFLFDFRCGRFYCFAVTAELAALCSPYWHEVTLPPRNNAPRPLVDAEGNQGARS